MKPFYQGFHDLFDRRTLWEGGSHLSASRSAVCHGSELRNAGADGA